MKTLKVQLIEAFERAGFNPEQIRIEYPVHMQHGDFSCNLAMALAKQEKKPPLEIAHDIITKLQSDAFVSETFEKIEAVKPGFINFHIRNDYLMNNISDIISSTDAYGTSNEGAGKKIIVEYSSPNSNKPLHLGHLRTNFIGMTLGSLYKAQGYDVIMTEIVNDRGMGISKSMLAYQLWGEGKTPESEGIKSDHFVGEYYVRYGQMEKDKPEIEEQVKEMVQKWEAEDTEVRALWKEMRQWAEEGYATTYEKIGSHFDMHEHESDIYDKGKQIVLSALEEGKAEKVEGGAVAVDLSAYNLGSRGDGKKILIKSDGTAVYMTQDLYLALQRWENHKPEKVFFVVGDEQKYHFAVLFKVLELFGYEWVKDRYVHVSYGMVNLPEGKMKSREGTVVDADDLVAELEAMARDAIQQRDDTIQKPELDSRATSVALAALKFFILKVDAVSTMVYDPKASLDFEGNTGPYIQYTYARLASIMRNGKEYIQSDKPVSIEPSEIERELLVHLSRYPEVVDRAASDLKPHQLAEYLYDLAAVTNSWYTQSPVLKADPSTRVWRLQLIRAIQIVLKNGLSILNIDTIEQM